MRKSRVCRRVFAVAVLATALAATVLLFPVTYARWQSEGNADLSARVTVGGASQTGGDVSFGDEKEKVTFHLEGCRVDADAQSFNVYAFDIVVNETPAVMSMDWGGKGNYDFSASIGYLTNRTGGRALLNGDGVWTFTEKGKYRFETTTGGWKWELRYRGE